MTSRTLTEKESSELRSEIEKVWAWSGCYFYPLHPTTRTDVLAFDGDLLETIFPEPDFLRLILSLPSSEIRCWRELDPSKEMCIGEFQFGYGYSETIVVNDSLSWIIYWSHEGTVTFGGDQLISKLKATVPNWENAVCKWGCNA